MSSEIGEGVVSEKRLLKKLAVDRFQGGYFWEQIKNVYTSGAKSCSGCSAWPGQCKHHMHIIQVKAAWWVRDTPETDLRGASLWVQAFQAFWCRRWASDLLDKRLLHHGFPHGQCFPGKRRCSADGQPCMSMCQFINSVQLSYPDFCNIWFFSNSRDRAKKVHFFGPGEKAQP